MIRRPDPCLGEPPPAPLELELREDGLPAWAVVALDLAAWQAYEAWERRARLWMTAAWTACGDSP